MKILFLRIRNFHQFENFEIDFRHPGDGSPLEKACLIGANGTGKSKILALLVAMLRPTTSSPIFDELKKDTFLALKVWLEDGPFWLFRKHRSHTMFLREDVEYTKFWKMIWDSEYTIDFDQEFIRLINGLPKHEFKSDPDSTLFDNSSDILVHALPDGKSSNVGKLPQSNLNEASSLFRGIPFFHESSYDEVKGFWKFLIYQIAKRDQDEKEFRKREEVRELSVAAAEERFREEYPEILTVLARHWNIILGRAGLGLDLENKKIPIQLSDNLEVFVYCKATGNQIPYGALSTGVRNYLFRIGHIFSLYFNREIKRGFLLVDEPELSLFPDLLYGMIERYIKITQNTQLFTATHSPIIASQFRPEERVILEFNDDSYVTSRRGVAPEGDDPNDLLRKDFSVKSLYGAKGVEMWEKFLALRRDISTNPNHQDIDDMVSEYLDIGNQYGFDVKNALPEKN